MMPYKTTISGELFAAAKTFFPGGVNSPVRAFQSVGGTPLFMTKGKGAMVYDVDGNGYLDFCCSWGPLILGHANDQVGEAIIAAVNDGTTFGTPTVQENKLASLVLQFNRYIEKIRFVSSGTEAVMSALRLARGYTGRNLIVKFDGCYHGHVDSLLVQAGSGLATFGTSSSAGVTAKNSSETLVLPLNDWEALNQVFERHGQQIAAVIIEPVPANNGLLLQDVKFLKALREVTALHGSLLIFDEVISGFRLCFCGAAGWYNIQPDLITYGKIIGGGMPVGAYGGRAEIMNKIAPEGPVYQAGTLSGNPVAMAAGYAQLQICLENGFYQALNEKTLYFTSLINDYATQHDLPLRMVAMGSIFWFNFDGKKTIRSAGAIAPSSVNWFKEIYHQLLERGIYLGPSGYEVGFVSAAHSTEQLTHAATIINQVVRSTMEAKGMRAAVTE
jgi:glutamate-1-semialdehyde 2,1-aminomutase